MHELSELTKAMAFIENKENYYALFRHVIKSCTIAEVVASALWNASIITDAEKLDYSARINVARQTAIARHKGWVLRRLEHSQSEHTIDKLFTGENMKLCTTTGDFSLHCENDIDRIKEISLAGFKYVDLSMYNNEASFYMHDGWKDDIKRLKEVADELNVKFVQAHSPAFETLETLDPNENWEEKLKETIRSIEICKELEIPMTVVHAGVKRNTSKEETLRLNKEFYDLLLPTMEKTGVTVLVENVGIEDNNGRYYLNSGKRLREFIEYYNHPLLKACWDVGHGNVFGNQYENIMALGKHLFAIHYNDNDKQSDLHTIPFLHKLDNDDAMRGLIDVGFKGPFTFEATGAIKYKIKKFDIDKGLMNMSLEVVRAYEKALYQTGKYLLNAYGIEEE